MDDTREAVRLRDVVESDLEVFLAQEHDPEAVRRSRFRPRERDAFMAHWRTRILPDPTVLVQAVTVDGETAGSVVTWWAEEDRRFLGYWLGRAYWGRGIATRALTLFLTRETTRPLYADPYTGNTASVRLLEKVGFRRDGTVWHDEDEHVLLVLDDDRPAAQVQDRR
ncbi:GNAT family N-acetyltransferase [Streptomyces sp. 4N509B]|uniref:GNAT family N-acetyltransferase n=1 Tax=Streptomyces sp. 4N509B TaxID=3457413 RepID=UPI003FCF9D5D